MQDNRYNKRLITAIILCITPLVSFCLDEYAPSLPYMVHALHTTTYYIQLSISLYVLSLGFSQWIFGILSDRYGRKIIFNSGIITALFGTLLCIISKNSDVLLLGRFIQGAGMGGIATTFAALPGDVFKGNELNRIASYTTLMYGMVPIMAPIIGGYAQAYFGWKSNFFIMFVAILTVGIFVIFKLPETHKPTYAHRLALRRLFLDYKKILLNKNYTGSVCCLIFSWTFIVVFSVVAPFMLQTDLKLSAIQYGHSALLIGFAYLIGNTISSILIKKISQKIMMFCGVFLMIISSITLLILISVTQLSWPIIMLPSFAAVIGVGLLFPRAYGAALNVFTDLSGIAGSLIGSLMCFGAVLLTIIVSKLSISSAFGYSITYLLLSLFCFASLLLANQKPTPLKNENNTVSPQ